MDIDFGGFIWEVRNRHQIGHPLLNVFSDKDANVRIDSWGQLHLQITRDHWLWYSSEIQLRPQKPLRYGIFEFFVRGGKLDPNIIFGISLWQDREHSFNIELSRCGSSSLSTVKFIINTPKDKVCVQQKQLKEYMTCTTHRLLWFREAVRFITLNGHHPFDEDFEWQESVVADSEFELPPYARLQPEKSTLIISLWLRDGKFPVKGTQKSIVVPELRYIPFAVDAE